MEREEILEQIKKLKKQLEDLNGQIIDFELPKNYDKMSKEEQKAYHKKQEKLKKDALAAGWNYVPGDVIRYDLAESIEEDYERGNLE